MRFSKYDAESQLYVQFYYFMNTSDLYGRGVMVIVVGESKPVSSNVDREAEKGQRCIDYHEIYVSFLRTC